MRSARGIERRCREDVAFRVICANQTPDHATIARFRARHEDAISGLFGGVLELCARAGLVRVGVVAVDGTKGRGGGDASRDAQLRADRLAPHGTWHAGASFAKLRAGGVSRAVHDLPDPAALFKAADILRGSVDAAEYKHLVLGLLFLKYVSESFEHRRAALRQGLMDPNSDEYVEDEHERAEVLDDKDEYVAENVFFIPTGARWSNEDPDPKKQGLLQAASLPDIGQRIDRALELIERENAQLPRGILPRIYARAPLSAEKLGALVETIGRIPFGSSKEARDYLGRTYEYFIATFPVLLRGIGGGGSCGRFRPRRQGPTRDFRAVG